MTTRKSPKAAARQVAGLTRAEAKRKNIPTVEHHIDSYERASQRAGQGMCAAATNEDRFFEIPRQRLGSATAWPKSFCPRREREAMQAFPWPMPCLFGKPWPVSS
jgi:hypothetical protein